MSTCMHETMLIAACWLMWSRAHFISGMCHTFYVVLGMRKATPTYRKCILLFANLCGIMPTDLRRSKREYNNNGEQY